MKPEGLAGSLDGLSLRASLGAICIPLVVLLAAHLHGLVDGGGAEVPGFDPTTRDIPQWLFVLEIGTFFLVPMLALTGAVTAVLFLLATLYAGRPPVLRCAFLLLSAAWAVLMAVFYVLVVIPRITTT